MKEFAILGTTASGKTDLALSLANKLDSVILSLDSLSVYKEIDIASAKPSKEERGDIIHFGIDEIFPNEEFSVALFFELYKRAKKFSLQNNKSLIIVGGTSFYLKSLLTGLSQKPFVSEKIKKKIAIYMSDIHSTYAFMKEKDFEYAKNISSNDSYRIEKWLEIFLTTNKIPSTYNKQTLTEPLIKDLPIYEIFVNREILRQKIDIRTKKMIKNGLIDEVFYLESKYTRGPKSLKAIGIKEVFDYLDGLYSLNELLDKISTNTARLAKRQRTFNKTQFKDFNIVRGSKDLVEKKILENSFMKSS